MTHCTETISAEQIFRLADEFNINKDETVFIPQLKEKIELVKSRMDTEVKSGTQTRDRTSTFIWDSIQRKTVQLEGNLFDLIYEIQNWLL